MREAKAKAGERTVAMAAVEVAGPWHWPQASQPGQLSIVPQRSSGSRTTRRRWLPLARPLMGH